MSELENVLFVLCIRCEWYVYSHWNKPHDRCTHPNNMTFRETWKDMRTKYARHPRKINKNNDCPAYTEKNNANSRTGE